MGNDLYWKITPKPVDEKLHGLSCNSWHILSEILNKDDSDMNGLEFSRDDLSFLRTVLRACRATSDNEFFIEELNDMINAIEKHDSITFTIRG
jgi:hypothetical protein